MKKLTRRHFVRISAAAAGALALGSIGLTELLLKGKDARHSQTRPAMGTFVTIIVIDEDEARANATIGDCFAEISRLSAVMSRHDPASKLSILNATGQLSNAPSELVSVLETARACSELTGGAFDVTVLPLVELYPRHIEEHGTPPDDKTVAEVLKLVGYQKLELKGRDIRLAEPGMGVTLDGIAKGYIVDQVAGLLRARGLTKVLVEAGGDLSLRGMRDDGQPWKVGIVHPRALSGYYEVIKASNGCITTSGDYEAAFTADFSHHHIIDPRSGSSPTELASATIIAGETAYADALSTAAMVLGKEAALTLIETLSGVETLLIDKQLKSYASSGFKAA